MNSRLPCEDRHLPRGYACSTRERFRKSWRNFHLALVTAALTVVVRLPMLPMHNESFEKLQVDGAQIAYRRVGNGRPLVVLNGFAATSADSDSFLYRLARFLQ